MVCPPARISSSTDHHHSSITTTPVTPESQVTITLKIAAAVRLTEAHCRRIAATVIGDITPFATRIAVPDSTISEVTVTCYETSEGPPSNAAAGL